MIFSRQGRHRGHCLAALLAFALPLAGCSMPRDPAGTMDRVERTGILRLGVVHGAELDEASRETLTRLLGRTGARPDLVRGDSEELLARLERGEIDLVFGELPMDSPWSRVVAFGQAQGSLGKVPKSQPVPRFAVMSGENGWLMAVAEASR